MVYVRDKDKPSNFKKFSLVPFNLFSFPICKPLNPEFYVIQRNKFILYRDYMNDIHGIRELVKNFKLGIPLPWGNHIIFFSIAEIIYLQNFLGSNLDSCENCSWLLLI